MGANLEQRLSGFGQTVIVGERRTDQRRKRSNRRSGRHRIGCVGGNEQRRLVATAERALKTGWNFDGEQYLAGGQGLIELGVVMQLLGDREELRVLQRRQDGAPDVAQFLQQHGGRQIVRRGVDRVAEQNKLQQWNRNHRREGHAIAAQLQEFLEQHRADATPEPIRADSGERAHWKLSLARPMRSMKTSSRDGDARSQTSPVLSR